jgi:hypothetical protein
MGYSRDPQNYPASYLELMELPPDSFPLSLPCESQKEAQNLRFRLYGFVAALAHQKHPHAQMGKALLFQVRGDCVVVEHRDLMPDPVKRALETRAIEMPVQLPNTEPSHQSTIEELYGGNKSGG